MTVLTIQEEKLGHLPMICPLLDTRGITCAEVMDEGSSFHRFVG